MQYTYAVGKRKTAIAQVRLFAGEGVSTINGKPFDQYVQRSDLFVPLLSPLKIAGVYGKRHFQITVTGSGESAQSQAIRHGLARAIALEEPGLRAVLKGAGLLKRDARKVERKKPGLHKARKASQWSKL